MTKSFSPDIFRNFDELLGKYWLGRWQTRAEICQNEKKEPEKNRTSKKQNQQKKRTSKKQNQRKTRTKKTEPAKNRTNEKPEPVKNRTSKQTRTSKIIEPEKNGIIENRT